MEVPNIPQVRGYMGTEKNQMLELNKRLESYLSRVKFLEEENKLLHGEAEALRQGRNQQAQRRQLEAELRKTREEVEAAWRKKDMVELEVSNLNEELQMLELQRQKVAATRAEAKKTLDESKKELEEEHRAQIWLQEKLIQLEKELQFSMEVHQEDVSLLKTKQIHTQYVTVNGHVQLQLYGLEDLGQELSQRASWAWQQAVDSYQNQLQRLEDCLTHVKSQMAQVNQEKKESFLRAQCLANELEAARDRKALLEKSVAQQKNRQYKELQQLQAHLESLERERVELSDQIAVILKDRHNLLQIKMSLGLEVATYRALLDSESLRPHVPSTGYCQSTSTFDEPLIPQTMKQGLIPNISAKLGTRSDMATSTLAMTTLQTPQEKFIGFEMTSKEQDGWCVESPGSPACSNVHRETEVNDRSLHEDFRANEAEEEVDGADTHSKQISPELRTVVTSLDTSFTEKSAIMEEEFNLQTAELEKNQDQAKKQSIMEEKMVPDSKNTDDLIVPSELTTDIEELLSSEEILDVSEKGNTDTWKADQLKGNFSDIPVEEISEIPENHLSAKVVHEPLLIQSEKQIVSEEADQMENIPSGSETEPTPEPELKLDNSPNEADSFGCESLSDHSRSDEVIMDDKTIAESHLPMTEVKVSAFSDETSFSHNQTKAKEESDSSMGSTVNGQNESNLTDKAESENLHVDELIPDKNISDEWNECELKSKKEDTGEEICNNEETEQKEVDKVMELEEQNHSNVNHTASILDSLTGEKTNEFQEHFFTDAEQPDLSDNDDLSNATNSWRTGGDLDSNDSYALENTLDDTRPLIRYRSDEADMNTQASHISETDSSDDEERQSGTGFFEKEKKDSFSSKGDHIMEDLTEESEWEEIQKSNNVELSNERDTDAGQAEEDEGLRNNKIEGMERNFEGNVGYWESDGKFVPEKDTKEVLWEEKMGLGQVEKKSDPENNELCENPTYLDEHMDYQMDKIVSASSSIDTKADLEMNSQEKIKYDSADTSADFENGKNETTHDSTDANADFKKNSEDEITHDSTETKADFKKKGGDETACDSIDRADFKNSEDESTHNSTGIDFKNIENEITHDVTDRTEFENSEDETIHDATDRAKFEKNSEDESTHNSTGIDFKNIEDETTYDSTDTNADFEKNGEDETTHDSTGIADFEKRGEDETAYDSTHRADFKNGEDETTHDTTDRADFEKRGEDETAYDSTGIAEFENECMDETIHDSTGTADFKKKGEDETTCDLTDRAEFENSEDETTHNSTDRADFERKGEDEATSDSTDRADFMNGEDETTHDTTDTNADFEKKGEDATTHHSTDRAEFEKNSEDETPNDSTGIADFKKNSEDEITHDSTDRAEFENSEDETVHDSTDRAEFEKNSEDETTHDLTDRAEFENSEDETTHDSTDRADFERKGEDEATSDSTDRADFNNGEDETTRDSTGIADFEKNGEDETTHDTADTNADFKKKGEDATTHDSTDRAEFEKSEDETPNDSTGIADFKNSEDEITHDSTDRAEFENSEDETIHDSTDRAEFEKNNEDETTHDSTGTADFKKKGEDETTCDLTDRAEFEKSEDETTYDSTGIADFKNSEDEITHDSTDRAEFEKSEDETTCDSVDKANFEKNDEHETTYGSTDRADFKNNKDGTTHDSTDNPDFEMNGEDETTHDSTDRAEFEKNGEDETTHDTADTNADFEKGEDATTHDSTDRAEFEKSEDETPNDSTGIADFKKNSEDETIHDSTDTKADFEKNGEDEITDDSTDTKADFENNSEDETTYDSTDRTDFEKNSEDETTHDSTDTKAVFEKNSEDEITHDLTDTKADFNKNSEDGNKSLINMELDHNFLLEHTLQCETSMGTKCNDSYGSETIKINPVNIHSDKNSENQPDNEEGIRKDSFDEIFKISSPSSPKLLAKSNGQSPSNKTTSQMSEKLLSEIMTTDEGSEMVMKSEETDIPPDQKEDDGENSSMLTHADFTDDLSLHSDIISLLESQDHTAKSDLEDSYSSDDESPNASQSLQSKKEGIFGNHQKREIMMTSMNVSGATEELFTEISGTLLETVKTNSDLFQDDMWGPLNSDSQEPDRFVQSDENISEYFTYTTQNSGKADEC